MYFLLFVPNALWPILMWAIFRTRISIQEALLHLAIVMMVAWGGVVFLNHQETKDVEIFNGEVTRKKQEKVSCEHSYECFCTTSCSSGPNGTQSCTRICQTCYEHTHDYDWNVYSNIGSFTIRRIDDQGVKTPPRWEKAYIGEPVSLQKSFENLVKGARHSLYNTESAVTVKANFSPLLPKYPEATYDYYRHNKLVAVRVSVSPEDRDLWNKELAELAKKVGPARKANPLVVLVNTSDPRYVQALEAHWLGGKLNDVILVVGTPDGKKILWADVISWSEKSLVEVVIRDEVLALPELSPSSVSAIMKRGIDKHFDKRTKASFEYLRDEIQPDSQHMAWLIFLCFVLNAGLTIFFHKHELFNRRW